MVGNGPAPYSPEVVIGKPNPKTKRVISFKEALEIAECARRLGETAASSGVPEAALRAFVISLEVLQVAACISVTIDVEKSETS